MPFKTSFQHDPSCCYSAYSNRKFNIREDTEGALSTLKVKLSPTSFKQPNEVLVNSFIKGYKFTYAIGCDSSQ